MTVWTWGWRTWETPSSNRKLTERMPALRQAACLFLTYSAESLRSPTMMSPSAGGCRSVAALAARQSARFQAQRPVGGRTRPNLVRSASTSPLSAARSACATARPSITRAILRALQWGNGLAPVSVVDARIGFVRGLVSAV